MTDALQNNVVVGAVWVVFAALTLYLIVTIWSHLSLGKLFWQNIFGSNGVALPKIARSLLVPDTSSNNADSQALVLVRTENEETQDKFGRRGVIYPVAGRNGLHFSAQRCTSCQLCAYVCPVAAITTQDTKLGYLRVFDLTTCVYCGLCEAACPTQAIKLTVNHVSTRSRKSDFQVQGEVEKKLCPECKRKVPYSDLMAERIYDLSLETKVVATVVSAENLTETLETGKKVQPNSPCPACQQSVLELEEKICG